MNMLDTTQSSKALVGKSNFKEKVKTSGKKEKEKQASGLYCSAPAYPNYCHMKAEGNKC